MATTPLEKDNNMRNIITKTETLGAVKARQVIWTTADAEATAGLSDSENVVTYTEITPFGRYLIAIEAAWSND